jgi:hypothetical protein
MINALNAAESQSNPYDQAWSEAVCIAPRLAVADNLRRHFGLDTDIDPKAAWIFNEANHNPDAVSIGIEVELQWRHILPDALADVLASGSWSEMSEQQQALFNEQAEPIGYPHQARCRETIALGIPSRGDDGLWEFSHRPARQYRTLVEEVRQLVEAGLVPESKALSMHVTLGNVAADERAGTLLRALEIAGGSTAQRLLTPNRSYSWARRGEAGVARRSSWKLELGHEQGFEFRSLAFQNLGQLSEVLALAQAGGMMIRQAQAGETGAVDSWQTFTAELETLWGIPAGCLNSHLQPASEQERDQKAWAFHARRTEDIALGGLTRQLLRNCVL